MREERQKRLQQPSIPAGSSALTDKTGLARLKSPPKPTMVARSTSASALPPAGLGVMSYGASKSLSDTATPTRTLPETISGTTTPNKSHLAGSGAASPFLTAGVDFHHHHHHHHHHHPSQHAAGSTQLRSATHSPTFLSKFYDEHRLPSNVPWLALPGTAATTSGLGGTESPTLFGRRLSDGAVSPPDASSTPAPSHQDKFAHESHQPQHHPHHYHLLSHQELAALSRNNSPMPLNEALPSYLRKKNIEPMIHMERSFSNPGSSTITQSAPVSPFMLPIHPTAYNKAVPHMRYPLGNVSDLDLSASQDQPAKPRAYK